jgi:hypothetical protein
MNRFDGESRGLWRLLPWLAAALAVGCGGRSDLATLEGRITLDGEPLPAVQVVFYQPDAGPEKNFIGETDADGRFVLTTLRKEHQGAAPGKYQVTLTTAFAGPELLETDPLPRERVPPRFRKLEFEVPAGGTTEANFELTSR